MQFPDKHSDLCADNVVGLARSKAGDDMCCLSNKNYLIVLFVFCFCALATFSATAECPNRAIHFYGDSADAVYYSSLARPAQYNLTIWPPENMTYFALTLIIDATQGNGSSFAKLSSFKERYLLSHAVALCIAFQKETADGDKCRAANVYSKSCTVHKWADAHWPFNVTLHLNPTQGDSVRVQYIFTDCMNEPIIKKSRMFSATIPEHLIKSALYNVHGTFSTLKEEKVLQKQKRLFLLENKLIVIEFTNLNESVLPTTIFILIGVSGSLMILCLIFVFLYWSTKRKTGKFRIQDRDRHSTYVSVTPQNDAPRVSWFEEHATEQSNPSPHHFYDNIKSQQDERNVEFSEGQAQSLSDDGYLEPLRVRHPTYIDLNEDNVQL